jgi:branched-chain amino acid transport system substrate-binding protein
MKRDEESPEIMNKPVEENLVSRRDFLKYAGIAGAVIGVGGGLGGVLAACGGGKTTTSASAGVTLPGKNKVVFGGARPITGALSAFEAGNWGPAYKLWVKDLNDAGGLSVGGTKIPVELKVYDDQSNLDTSTRLMTKLIQEDKVDLLMAPCSTAFLFAAAKIANDAKYVLMSAEGGATTLEEDLKKQPLPYFFQVLNYSNHYQLPTFADLMKTAGAKSVSICYIDDLHGIEYQKQAQVDFPAAGMQILSNTAVPLDIKDMSSIIKKMQTENPDVAAFFVYPPINPLAAGTMIQLNWSPKCVLWGPTGASQWFYDSFKGALEGTMFEGAWSVHSTPTAKAYYDKLAAFVTPANVDFWGGLIYRAQLEALQTVIGQVGLDQTKIAEGLRKGHFKTSMSDDFHFDENQILNKAAYSGQIGQWQKGIAEVVDAGDKRTAAPIYPKLGWTEAAASSPSTTAPAGGASTTASS